MNLRESSPRVLLGAPSLVAARTVVVAQDYPARPLRLIVPWPPGGGADVIARVIFQKSAIKSASS